MLQRLLERRDSRVAVGLEQELVNQCPAAGCGPGGRASCRTGLVFDPALFRPDAVPEETAEFNAALEETLRDAPTVMDIGPPAMREVREAGQGTFGPIVLSDMAEERTVPGPAGDVPVRLFVPDSPAGVLVYFHGGGWVLGRAHHADPLMERFATEANVAVVSVDYRLAPEDPYPAGPDDCEAAALWVLENGVAEFGTDRLATAGASAGAHLAAVTLLRLRDRHGYTGSAATLLTYGVFDLSLTPGAATWGERKLVLSTPFIEWTVEQFVPDRSRRREPDISPLYANLTGMPPALFTVGTADPILDDTLFMYARWVAAGNDADLDIHPGGVHGFNAFPIEAGRRANRRMVEFVQKHLG